MNREVHVRIWERPEVRVLWATRHEDQFPSPMSSDRCRFSLETFARSSDNGRSALAAAIGSQRRRGPQLPNSGQCWPVIARYAARRNDALSGRSRRLLAAEKEGAADRARQDIGRYGDFRPRIGIEADHLTTNRTPGGQPDRSRQRELDEVGG